MSRKTIPSKRPEIGKRRVGDINAQNRSIDQWTPISQQSQGNAGKGSDGAARAEQLNSTIADLAADAMDRLEAGQPDGHIVDHLLEAVGIESRAPEPLGQGNTPTGRES